MANIKRELLSGWGLTPSTHCATYRPEKEREVGKPHCRPENTAHCARAGAVVW